MSRLLYRNPRYLVLWVLVSLVAGLGAFSRLPRQEDPRLKNRFALVFTRYPGASASRVEAQVTEKLESKVREVRRIEHLNSVSRDGISVLAIQLEDRVEDPAPLWSEVRDRLADAERLLPPGAARPIFDERRTAGAYGLVVGLTWELDAPPAMGILQRLAEELSDRLRNVPGTELVRRYGGVQEEVLVELDPGALAAAGLEPQQVAARVAAADSKGPAGLVRAGDSQLLVEVRGEIDGLERLARIPLLVEGREREGGTGLRLGDVAHIRRGWRPPPRDLALLQGRRGVAIASRLEDGRRIDDWAARSAEVLDAFEAELPAGIRLRRLFDQAVYTSTRMVTLQGNLLTGGGLVVAVALLMMGWRSALLVSSSLPLALCLVLFGLQILGIPLHQMSITGLILALGLMIDNAIVVVDEMGMARDRGEGAEEAMTSITRHLFMPLLGSTATTVVAFLPVVLLWGNIGEFVGPLGYAVVLCLVSSFLVSLGVVPALVAYLGRPGEVSGGSWWQRGVGGCRLSRAYHRALEALLRHPWRGLAVSLALPVAGFLALPHLPQQFFPPADRDQFYVQVWTPAGRSLAGTRKVVERLHAAIGRQRGVHDQMWFVGTTGPSVYYNMMQNVDDQPNYAQGVIRAESYPRTVELVPRLQQELDALAPEAQVVVRAIGQGPPVESPVEVRVYGPSLEGLRRLGEEVRRLLHETPRVLHTRATLQGGRPQLELDLDEDAVALSGAGLAEAAGRLAGASEGTLGGSWLEGISELPVRIGWPLSARDQPGDLGDRRLRTPDGGWVSLDTLGGARLTPVLDAIPRRSGERLVELKAYIEADALPKQVLQDFQALLARSDLHLPEGYRLEIGGDEEAQGEAMESLLAYTGVLVALMVAILVLSFGSFRLALLLGVAAALSVGLGGLAIWVSGLPFGFMAAVGTAGLIGVALNDSIVVLASLRADPAARAGDLAARVRAVSGCTRHVLTTTLTTVGGFLPLYLAPGGFWPPLAVVIAGGVLGATLVALVFVPAAHALVGDPAA